MKLVEYGSLTCPHCAEFAEKGAPKLIDKYVKTGRVSFEFRNFLRDGLDMSMSLIARCGGPERFFPLSEAMFKDQREFFERAQAATAGTAAGGLPAEPGRLRAACRPAAVGGAARCPVGQEQRLPRRPGDDGQARADYRATSTTQFPGFSGTPSFVINGKLLEQTATWDKLEPQIRDALGS